VRIGLISDTHGKLRPEVFTHFAGVDRILHAGDVGRADLLVELEAIAPVTAVWGNVDDAEVRARLPERAELELEGHTILVVHGHQLGSPWPEALRRAYPGPEIIVFGHTHLPVVDEAGGRLVVNPGGAGPARFYIRPSIAILTLQPGSRSVQSIEL
jgi:putative phosphoesterase